MIFSKFINKDFSITILISVVLIQLFLFKLCQVFLVLRSEVNILATRCLNNSTSTPSKYLVTCKTTQIHVTVLLMMQFQDYNNTQGDLLSLKGFSLAVILISSGSPMRCDSQYCINLNQERISQIILDLIRTLGNTQLSVYFQHII